MARTKKTKIIAIVGKSGSGKSTMADALQEIDIPPVQSHTTRPKRDENDTHHVFVSEEEFDQIEGRVAETNYGGYRYCGVIPGGSPCYSYVIDENGLRMLMDRPDIELLRILVLAPTEDRKERSDQNRFERDKDFQFELLYDNIILNNRSVDALKERILQIGKNFSPYESTK